jgi:flagellar FliL protein
MMAKGDHNEEEEDKHTQATQPKLVQLETITVNQQREQGDHFLQVGVTLKIFDPLMEEAIKTNLPEIRSKLLLLLSSKRASELSTPEGKQTLAEEIIEEANGVLGIEKLQEEEEGKSKKKKRAPAHGENDGVVDVLFTSFIIQ